MKSSLLFAVFLLCFSSVSFGKIIYVDGKVFVQSKGKQAPLAMVNNLIDDSKVSAVKLYADGKINAISFAKKNEKEKLYSVDEQGYAYAIEPFASYHVKKADQRGFITFKEHPRRKYRVNEKGFFIY